MGGLSQFGARLQVLQPGERSSDRHWHEREDEFLYVVAGVATVLEEDGPYELHPGDAACWPGGVANAHAVENRASTACAVLVVGTRLLPDRCHYPESGELLEDREDGSWRLTDAGGAELGSGTIDQDRPVRLA